MNHAAYLQVRRLLRDVERGDVTHVAFAAIHSGYGGGKPGALAEIAVEDAKSPLMKRAVKALQNSVSKESKRARR